MHQHIDSGPHRPRGFWGRSRTVRRIVHAQVITETVDEQAAPDSLLNLILIG